MNIKISEIKIGNRFRKNLGDISSLAYNIEKHGLLHPPVITQNYELICGRRRIEAYKLLAKSEIEVNILKLNHSNVSEAEADENIVRKNFTIDEIASIDEFYRKKEESEARQRQKQGRPSGKFPTGRAREKIAVKVGISDRTLEKIRTIKDSSTEGDFANKVWEKVAAGKIKIDKGYNQIRRFQRIKEAEKLASSSHFPSSNENFSLHLGDMMELGNNIPDSSIDLIFTDPPYDEKSLYLYGELAKLAQRVLKSGASIVTVVGHYAIFKINDLIRSNSNLIYHWEISVNHTGHKKRLHGYRVWAYHKPLLWYYKPLEDGNGHGPTMYQDVADVVQSTVPMKDDHEWEQSTTETEHMIKPLTVAGNVVLDPFMGSGTTAIASLELNRKFIGIEIDEVHYNNACNRLAKLKASKDKHKDKDNSGNKNC